MNDMKNELNSTQTVEELMDEMTPLIPASQLSDQVARYEMMREGVQMQNISMAKEMAGEMMPGLDVSGRLERDASELLQAEKVLPAVNSEYMLELQLKSMQSSLDKAELELKHYRKLYEVAASERSQLAVRNESLRRQVEFLEEQVRQGRSELHLRRRLDTHAECGNLSEMTERRYGIVLNGLG